MRCLIDFISRFKAPPRGLVQPKMLPLSPLYLPFISGRSDSGDASPPEIPNQKPPPKLFVLPPVYEQILPLCCDPGVLFFRLVSTMFEPIPPLCCDPGFLFFAIFNLFWSQSPRYAAILGSLFSTILKRFLSQTPRNAAILGPLFQTFLNHF